jgi:hypothetical protein
MKKKFSDGTIRGPYTSAELFEITDKALKQQGLLPDILDYGLPTGHPVQIDTYEWDVIGIPNFGGSEGIYLDLYADGIVSKAGANMKREHVQLGTYKCLGRSKEDFLEMCRLLTEFVFWLTSFLNQNMDRFTWVGYDLTFLNDNGTRAYGLCEFKTKEKALERFEEECARTGRAWHATLLNNQTGEVEDLYAKDFPGKEQAK